MTFSATTDAGAQFTKSPNPRNERRARFNPQFPNAVARDREVTPSLLVLLAYRSMFVKWRLDTGLVGKVVSRGLGEEAADKAVQLGKKLGYLDRRQPPPGSSGKFRTAVETLCLPKCTRSSGRMIYLAWFDGSLDVKEMAALLYVRAGTGEKGPLYRRHLEKRFGWSRPTAHRVLKALVAKGLVNKKVSRGANQTFKSTTYAIARIAKDKLAPSVYGNDSVRHAAKTSGATVKKPGDGLPGHGFPGCLLTVPVDPHELPMGERAHALSPEQYAVRASREPTPTISDNRLHDIAHATQTLLGWIGEADGGPEVVFEDEPTEEALEAVALAMPDAELKARLVKATGARVAREILSPAGLYAIRWLAAGLVPDDDDEDLAAEEALSIVLVAIERRIGSRPDAYLRSLALIGKRLAAERYAGWVGEHLYETRAAKTSAVPVDLAELAKADGARTLAPGLTRTASSFNAFRDQQAGLHRVYPHEIERIVCGVLRRHMIDGKPVGSVKSWRYFESVIAEELHQQRVAEQGLRPGDVFGAHRLKGTANASVDRN